MQSSFGLDSGDEPVAQALPDSGKEPLTQTSIVTLDDAEVSMDKDNTPPITEENSTPLSEDAACETTDIAMEASAESESPQCSSSSRTVRGMSRRAARRRVLAAPYQADKGVDSILEFMKRSERQLEQFQIQQRSEQHFLALLQQQSSSIDGVLVSTLQTIQNLANAILSKTENDSSNSV